MAKLVVTSYALALHMDDEARTLQNAVSPYIARLREAANRTFDVAPKETGAPRTGYDELVTSGN